MICIFKRSMQKLCDEYRRSGFYWEVYVSFIFLCYSLNIYLPDKFPWLKMFHIIYINQLYVALTSCFTHTHTHTPHLCLFLLLNKFWKARVRIHLETWHKDVFICNICWCWSFAGNSILNPIGLWIHDSCFEVPQYIF